ncbi:dihydroxyacetone kinase family protein [Rathayibacter soli]|uniref:dihydroxyacetone kinase family protein n=1 Tax=Rathayibacter soli TaxID=3144168 RepID=UPI0027E410CC|nr:dihydroxyacetone kinase family protein [Glaciibacter superstes]
MTYLYNDPVDFTDDFIDGFIAANGRWVRRVAGGVVRNAKPVAGQVAVIIGGGSGHYPAFAGLVGAGLAHGAAMGNLFASPSAQQVYSVAKAASAGGGVLLSYGNYAGDVLNFTQAEKRLIAEGIDCRTVVVTDDVSSAALEEIGKRRGIAGDLAVFKAAAAAAEAGADLAEVARIAAKANDRTRSFGVAFSGCTLPGATEPLFTVPAGRMAIGMGIHGEQGIDETAIPRADDLAVLLVSRLLEERPANAARGARAGVILNGLGSVKYEELFVLYRTVSRLLSEAGVDIVEPEVGELVTSFQMAGLSLTLFWLDDELEPLWRAAADAPAYRKGSVIETDEWSGPDGEEEVVVSVGDASTESQISAEVVVRALAATKKTVDDNADELGRLDAIAGDGDHGIGMQRGATAAATEAEQVFGLGAGAGTVLSRAGDAWADRAGGTSGALWGIALRAIGTAVGDTAAADAASVAAGVRAARDEIAQFGKAQLGDKTLLDTLIPFSAALSDAAQRGDDLATAWGEASAIADQAAEHTAALVPKIGRARPHIEKSVGTPDPGAVSMALIIRAIHHVLLEKGSQSD